MPAHANEVQKMAPAPWLPSVLMEEQSAGHTPPVSDAAGAPLAAAGADDRPATVSAVAASSSSHAQHSYAASIADELESLEAARPGYAEQIPVETTLIEAGMPGTPFAEVFARIAEQQAQLSAIHQQFLIDQSDLHSRFLEMRQRTAGKIRQQFEAGLRGPYGPVIEVPAATPESIWAPVEPAPVAPVTVEDASSVAPPVTYPAAAQAAEGPAPIVPAVVAASQPGLAHRPPAPVVAPQVSYDPAALELAEATLRPATSPVGKAHPGPAFDRAQLEALATGRISSEFGPKFVAQDGYPHQVRLPAPPLLLIDRVAGIDGAAGSMAASTVWTELALREGQWFINDVGRMPVGPLLESAQSHRLLMSWMGADLVHRGERVYRPIQMDVTFHHALPQSDETLTHEVRVTPLGEQDGVPMFAWECDARVGDTLKLTVRDARVGLFKPGHAARAHGSTWSPSAGAPTGDARTDAPEYVCDKRTFTADEVRAFVEGRAADCFGQTFHRAYAHSRSPATARDLLQLLHRVTAFDPVGGPWGRGYLRAETSLSAKDWFFAANVKDDPRMPASLMLEGAVQAMSFYLAAMGYTVERDGWRFEPVLEQTFRLHCIGDVTPADQVLAYEIFVDEVLSEPEPTLYACVAITADGRQVMHTSRLGVRVALDHPLDHWRRLGPHKEQETGVPVPLRELGGLVGHEDPRALRMPDGFVIDYKAMIAGSWGPPHQTYGALYANFDPLRKMPRAPAPPFQFVTRAVSLDGPLGEMKTGLTVELEYDIPPEVWYFKENGYPVMPWCVLIEIALQGCGWLAMAVGSFWAVKTDVMFRNLDGTGTLTAELMPDSGTIMSRVKITNISQSAGIIIQSFVVECFVGDKSVYTMDTVFGFFPKEAFENQVGLPVPQSQKDRIVQPANRVIDLTSAPAKYCAGTPRLAGKQLRMLDRIIGYWPDGGKAGKGYVRGEKDINPSEWFFKAHFFRDPVQPGSLGHEAFCQLLQWVMIEEDMGKGIPYARFEPIMLDHKLSWKYRGQITPSNKRITSEAEILEVGEDEKGRYIIADCWLWVDGKCIYLAKSLGMRIVRGEPPAVKKGPAVVEKVLDPKVDTWINDHCPTWTMPSLPAMSMVDLLASAAQTYSGQPVVGVSGVQVRRWLAFPSGPVKIRTEVTEAEDGLDVSLFSWREAANAAMSRFELVASGKMIVGEQTETRPEPWAPLEDAEPVPSPYDNYLFHGPTFQILETLRIGPTGSSAILETGRNGVPYGALNQGLLDALTHAIPHGNLEVWDSRITPGQVGYPYRVPYLHVFSPLPTQGEARVEVRFRGFDGDTRYAQSDIQLIADGRVVLAMRLVEVLLPQGKVMKNTPEERISFLVHRQYVPTVSMSRFDGPVTRLSAAEVSLMDWIPGNVGWVYNIPREQRGDLVAQVAIKEHVSRRAFVHPSTITVSEDLSFGVAAMRPLRRHPVKLTRVGADVEVMDAGPPQHYYAPVADYWRRWHDLEVCPPEDIYTALGTRFLGDVIISDPDAFAKVKGRSCLWLANHQVGIESLLMTLISQALTEVRTLPLAKAEHRTSYLGWLMNHPTKYPGFKEGGSMVYFEREDLASLLEILDNLAEEMRTETKSVLVHVEGTRSLSCRKPVEQLSSGFIDLALRVGVPIIPLRFIGGLPVEPVEKRIEFPYGYGRQDYWIGRPILPEELAGLRYRDRKQLVLDAINNMGVLNKDEEPMPGDPAFGEAVAAWMARTGASHEFATIFVAMTMLESPSAEIRTLLEGARTGALEVEDSAKGRWLQGLAEKVYGPRGPRIVVVP